MVTDEQFKELQARVKVLEKKLSDMSIQLSSMYMRESYQGRSEISVPAGNPAKKDTTRYLFEGQYYTKRQLVRMCVIRYVKDHPDITGIALREAFPDFVQGSLGVVRKVEDAERYSRANKRFFFNDEDILRLSDGCYVICSQWDIKNISSFLQLIDGLEYEVEPIRRSV